MYCLAYITSKNSEEAEKIALILLERKLAACVNIIPGIISLFSWQEKIERSEEVLLIAKTHRDLFDELQTEVKNHHSYDCPCIIKIPFDEGSDDFLSWISHSLKKK